MADERRRVAEMLAQGGMGGYEPDQVSHYQQPDPSVMGDYMRGRSDFHKEAAAAKGVAAAGLGLAGLAYPLAGVPAGVMGAAALTDLQRVRRAREAADMWDKAPYKNPGPMY